MSHGIEQNTPDTHGCQGKEVKDFSSFRIGVSTSSAPSKCHPIHVLQKSSRAPSVGCLKGPLRAKWQHSLFGTTTCFLRKGRKLSRYPERRHAWKTRSHFVLLLPEDAAYEDKTNTPAYVCWWPLQSTFNASRTNFPFERR